MIIHKFKNHLFMVLLFTVPLFAQDKIVLSVEQAIDIALQKSKPLNSSYMKAKSAGAKLSETNAMRLPAIKLSAAYRRLSEVDPFVIETPFGTFPIAPGIFDNYSTQLSLTQPLFTGFKLSSASNIAEYSANAANEEFTKDKSELIYNVRNAYWSLYKAHKLKDVFDETVLQVQSHLNDAKNLEKAGLLTRNDVLKLEVQLSDVKYKQAESSNIVKLATLALNNIISIPLQTEIELASSVKFVQGDYDDLSKLIDAAVMKRPELKAADFRVKAGEAGVTMAKSSWYPQIAAFANYYYAKPNQRIVPAKNEFNNTWDAGVSLNINVWDWLTTAHQTEQAEAQLAQAVDAVGIIKDAVTLEVTQNFFNMNQSKTKIEISELSIKQAEENLRVTSDKFKNGLATASDLIDAETALTNAKFNMAS